MAIIFLLTFFFCSITLRLSECYVRAPALISRISAGKALRRKDHSYFADFRIHAASTDDGFADNPAISNMYDSPQKEILMPNFDGKVVQWFKKVGDKIAAGEAILAVESLTAGKNGFRVNIDIQAPKNGYLAARYKLEGDAVSARNVLGVLVPDEAALSLFSSTSGGPSQEKSWWSTPYKPGRPNPFTAKSPLGAIDQDVAPAPTTSAKSKFSPIDDNNNEGNTFSSRNASRRPVTRSTSVSQRPVARSRPFEAPASRDRPQAKGNRKRRPDSSASAGGSASSRPSVFASRSNQGRGATGSSIPSQSTLGSMNLGESSLPRRSTLSSDSISYRQSYSNNRYYQDSSVMQPPPATSSFSGQQNSIDRNERNVPNDKNFWDNNQFSQAPSYSDNDYAGSDFVAFLESRGMRDANMNMATFDTTSQQGPYRNQAVSPMMAQETQPAYYNGENIIQTNRTRKSKHRPPTKYDIAASTLGGSIWGGSLALGAMMAYPNNLEMSISIPPVLLGVLFGGLGYVGAKTNNDAGYSIRHIFGCGNFLKYRIKNIVSTTQKAVENTANTALTLVSTGSTEPPMRLNHLTIKTRDIIEAIEFYSLLGFESTTAKFRVGEARAAWLDNNVIGAGRIELMEVPYDGTARALDRVQNQDLLGYNSLTLDVTDIILQNRLSSLSELLGYLNEKSFALYNKGLRLAVEPQKREVGGKIYDVASLYDPDGSLVELQYRIPDRQAKILMKQQGGLLVMRNRGGRPQSSWEDDPENKTPYLL